MAAGLRRHAVRALASTASAVLFFHCLSVLPIAEATVLIFCAPLMIAPLAHWLLGEKMRPMAVLALGVGFLGMLITDAGRIARRRRPPGGSRASSRALPLRRSLFAFDRAAASAGAEETMRL